MFGERVVLDGWLLLVRFGATLQSVGCAGWGLRCRGIVESAWLDARCLRWRIASGGPALADRRLGTVGGLGSV